MKKTIIFLLVLLIATTSFAQKKKKKEEVESSNKQKRIEIELNSSYDKYNLIPLDSQGLIVIYNNEERDFVLGKYNTMLKKEYTQVLNVEQSKNKSILSYAVSGNKVYVLFAKTTSYTSSNYTDFKEYTILQFDPDAKKQVVLEGKTEKPFAFVRMVADNDKAILFGIDELPHGTQTLRTCGTYCLLGIPALFGSLRFPYNPGMEVINFKKKSIDHEKVDYGKKARAGLISADINEGTNEGYLLIKNKISRKISQLSLRNFHYDDQSVKMNRDIELRTNEDKEFFQARVNVLNDKEKLLFGVYGKPTTTTGAAGNTGPYTYTEGIYFSKINGDKQAFTKYIPWVDIKRYKESFSNGTQKRMEKTKDKGKDFRLQKQIVFHDIVEDENQYLLICETYGPRFHTETTVTYVNGRPSYQTRTVFDGYEYEDCLIMSFSKDGKLLWDDLFDLPYYRTYNPGAELVTIAPQEDRLLFTYFYNGRVRTRYLEEKGISEDEDNVKIKTTSKHDDVSSSKANVRHWFGNTYVVFGFAQIKNKEKWEKEGKKGNKTRKVLYINKLEIGEDLEDDEESDED